MKKIKSQKYRLEFYGYLFIFPAVLSIIIFSIYPNALSIHLAFTKYNGFDMPQWVGFSNFVQLLLDDKFFWIAVSNTWVIWLKAFFFQIIFALFLAYIFVFTKIKGITFFRTVYYLPNLIATVVIAQIFNVLVLNYPYSLLNISLTELSLIAEPIQFLRNGEFMRNLISFISWFMWFGYLSIIVNAGMSTISGDYREAALLDGCNDIKFFVYIVLPLIRPTLFYITLTSLVGGLQLFDLPFILKGANDSTLTIIEYLFNHAFRYENMGYGAAIAILLFLKIMLISWGLIHINKKLQERYI